MNHMEQIPQWIEQHHNDAKLINELLAENIRLRDENMSLSEKCIGLRERIFTCKAISIAIILGFGSLLLAEQLSGMILPLP